MEIKRIVINGDVTVVTDDTSTLNLGVTEGEVESITIPLTDGRMAQFNVSDKGEGWIRFDSKDCLGRSAWNKNGSTEGDIERSDLQEYLDERMMPLLPEWLREMIIPTMRISGEGRYATRLFVPDASEVFAPDEDWYESRYERLDYYGIPQNRIKAGPKFEDQLANWWTASALSGTVTRVVIVTAYGMSIYSNASDAYGVPVCFRINSADLGGLISEALNSGGTVRRIEGGRA